MSSLCSIHDAHITVVCLMKSCPNQFLCYKCLLEHEKTHYSYLYEYSDLYNLYTKNSMYFITELKQEPAQIVKFDQLSLIYVLMNSNVCCNSFFLTNNTCFYFCRGNIGGCTSKVGVVWGTDIYTCDSDLCLAAIHSGILDEKGGICLLEMLPGRKKYNGSNRYGIESLDYASFAKSVSFKKL